MNQLLDNESTLYNGIDFYFSHTTIFYNITNVSYACSNCIYFLMDVLYTG